MTDTSAPTRIVDPSTGRPAFSGPQGQPGSAQPTGTLTSTWTMPDGTKVYYDPNASPASGNVQALQNAGVNVGQSGVGPGGKTWAQGIGSAAGAAAGAAPGTPGGGLGGGPPGSVPPPDPNAAATQQAQNDAIGILTNELTQWGFGQDAIAWATQEIQSNKSVDQVLYDLRQQPFYKNSIFGKTNDARVKNNLPVMSEAQILSYKDSAAQIARAAGLPQGFMTDTEMASLMGNDVSVSELDSRITKGYEDAMAAPPQVRANLQAYYGVSTGGLAAYYLNPDNALPLLQKELGAAHIGAEANLTGFGDLQRAQAEMLQAQGVSTQQAESGFSTLGHMAQAYNPLPGEQPGTGVSKDEQIAGQFSGNAQAQLDMQLAAQRRQAAFQGSEEFSKGQSGAEGLGTAAPKR